MAGLIIAQVAALLLVGSGGAKLFDPDPTAGAMAAAGIRMGRFGAYVVAVAEIVTGLAFLVMGGQAGWALAVVYAGFAAFVGVALARHRAIQSCGCFGRADTPPTILHLAFNLVAAAAGALAALNGAPGLIESLPAGPMEAGLYLLFLGAAVFGIYLMLAELPRTMAAARGAG
ncbi:MAG TPA: MauE/DoxX family redox-associated membrane protein [Acidimicrobiia bacterium]